LNHLRELGVSAVNLSAHKSCISIDSLMIKNLDIVCFGGRRWNVQPGTQEHVLKRLARENRVLYVEAYKNIFSALADPARRSSALDWTVTPERSPDGLYLWAPPPVLPLARKLVVPDLINKTVVLRALKRVLKQLGFTCPILWFYSLRYSFAASRLESSAIIYHCVDAHYADAGDAVEREELLRREKQLAESADIVICTARSLYQRLVGWNRESYYIPNGAEVERFTPTVLERVAIAQELTGIKRPVLGYCGIINRDFDVDLIRCLAEQRPSWSIALIGRVTEIDTEIAHLRTLPNVHFLGMQPHSRIPSFVKGFDICLLPYKVNEMTRSIYPLKFFEYLATGKPVVSTRLPELEEFSDLIYFTRDGEQFLSRVEAGLAESDQQLSGRRVAVALANGWDKRMEQIGALVSTGIANLRARPAWLRYCERETGAPRLEGC